MEELSFDKLPKAVAKLSNEISEIKRILLQNKEETPEKDQLFSVKEAATFLEVSAPTIYGYVQRKQIPVMKKHKKLYFSKLELIDWIKTGRKKTIEEIQKEVDRSLATKKRRL
ncbi:helix-turn-helix domain-containing protein [Aquimarina sp. MMG016]|uniref:helix-turn-helix domain-containing protein n=1 Tax=Aquimarina sp. MMG016 TaxID=2822690 RepID=UPI001B39E1A9|nr:helix-turn-helix domain-containing protein [Aquimarina sp. MMG016]MBQ4820577.1 helix-turn-helix domain-containing protein [Aquimarina sp. MMG016]